jgi:succinoglycan biosynthesis protein ExoL
MPPASVSSPTAVVFFSPDITDVSTIKRARTFLDYGYRLTMFSFRRQRYNRGYQPDWPCVMLGQTEDGRYGQRLLALLKALPRIARYRRLLQQAELFYARNIDQLLLALVARWLAGRKIPIVYEVLDIQPILVGRRWFSRGLRWIERFGLRRIDLLVLSSPGFWNNYFSTLQDCRRPWFLLENKLPPQFGAQSRPSPDKPSIVARGRPRWTVGYCGLIRGQETFDLIVRLAGRLEGLVQFKFRGLVTTVDRESFARAMDRHDNLVYEGPYVSTRDLPEVYNDLDFAWAIDLENVEHNSRWLLPCRYYEAGFFGVPCLTARSFEVARLVERDRTGWSFDAPYEEALVAFFRELDPAVHAECRARLMAMPKSNFVAVEDGLRLCQVLDQTAC